uniref:Outer arm dynein light chain 1 protein n=1 Tax=Cucumis melo TaxID=3656 RepID=A0A9I9CH94_CUCME
MAKFNCFSGRTGKKKKTKTDLESQKPAELNYLKKTLQVSIHHSEEPFQVGEGKSSTLDVAILYPSENNSKLDVKVTNHESPAVGAVETEYEGEDERDDNSIKRNLSDFDLPAQDNCGGEFEFQLLGNHFDKITTEGEGGEGIGVEGEGVDASIQNGHLSDPGIGKAVCWASPKLKRSCSNLETRDVLRDLSHQLPPPKSQSFEKLQELANEMRDYVDPGSPGSIMTHRSADKVMLKKRSSSQILPSRSRRLWWKLFLWSHRNLQKPWTIKATPTNSAFNQQGGYCSDNLEPNRAAGKSMLESPESFTEESWTNGPCNNKSDDQDQVQENLCNGVSGLWPQNQWVAFSAESSSLRRVDEWVKDLQIEPCLSIDEVGGDNDEATVFPPSPERTSTHTPRRGEPNLTEEILYANSVIQSLNSSSTVAHISGIGLRAIPTISHLSGLRSVNLSGNLILHINPGSLPKGLHTLNLSRNKISVIEGLKELTRLRILDLSYNRISRIGHGLSNCTIIKELYLAGNKISDVEGLHRILKLTVLDLSFNKISTTKALGQLVANYNTLQALNLLGNPIQSNVSDDQLRKAVTGLLPNLVYLNKQAIKAQRAREVATDSIAKAALGNSNWSSRRRTSRKTSHIPSSSISGHRSTASVAHKGRHRSKAPTVRHSSLRMSSSALASSTR